MEFQESNLNLAYCRASMAKRFANYIIDLIFVYILLFFMGFFLEIISPGLITEANIGGITDRVISLIFYWLIMFFTEFASQGKSIGKLITGTRAVNKNGSRLSIEKSLLRNLIRAIPFNALSALGTPCNPWHDSWSDTLVVDDKLLDLEERKDVFYSALKERSSN